MKGSERSMKGSERSMKGSERSMKGSERSMKGSEVKRGKCREGWRKSQGTALHKSCLQQLLRHALEQPTSDRCVLRVGLVQPGLFERLRPLGGVGAVDQLCLGPARKGATFSNEGSGTPRQRRGLWPRKVVEPQCKDSVAPPRL